MNLLARLTALESRHTPAEPWAVQVIVDVDGASVGVAYTDRTESMTLREYRDTFGERYRGIERWVLLGDAEPIDDRRCVSLVEELLMTTTSCRARERHADVVAPDRGCYVSPRCTSCPLNRTRVPRPGADDG